jgi:CRISPR-associated protein (TIGR02584 family)
MEPARYAKRTLLAVTGLTPQVVTESLYALAVRRVPAFVPTELELVTTAEGAERARLSLLSTEPGWFARLRSDYDLPPIAFGANRIHVLRDADGRPLADIRQPTDNERAADLVTERVRALTADPDRALHVSIAGGRKTMGYYLGYALSLFGRPQDRLSHVLVAEPFESSWDFFYPTPYSRVITTRENKLADTAEAEVTLAEIPFVSLRDGLPERLLKGQASFGQTVAAARRALEPPTLTFDFAERRVRAGGEWLPLAPADLAFYALVARRRKAGLPGARWDTGGLAKAYLVEYSRIVGEMSGDFERAEASLARGMSEGYFDQRKSRTNGALKAALGLPLAAPYLIRGEGARPRTSYALRVDPDAIRFDPDAHD